MAEVTNSYFDIEHVEGQNGWLKKDWSKCTLHV